MIVDSHSHIFEEWSGACGLPSVEMHLRYLQKTVCRPSAKTFRLRDGAPSDPSALYREGTTGWEGMYENKDFRIGPYGRLEFKVDDEVHYVQYMPVAMATIQSTPDLMISHMNAAGVDHCVLQAGFTYGYMNDYNALAQRQFPLRFSGLFHVNVARADTPEWMAEARHAIENLGLRGMYYSLEEFSRYDFDTWFNEERFDEFWNLVESTDTPVFIEFSALPDYNLGSMVAMLGRLAVHMDRFPAIRWVMVMAPPVQFFAQDGTWVFPDEAEAVYSRENVMLEICYPISWGGVWDYPYPEAQALIRGLHSKFGSEKLVWGSDMPNVERFCTYKQSLDYLRRYCDFFTERELDRVLGDNLVSLLNIPGTPS